MRLITPKSGSAAPTVVPALLTPAAENAKDGARARWRAGLEFGAASRRGSYHPENEDSYLLEQAGTAIGVADGVGGGALGKVASRVMTARMRLLSAALCADAARMRAWLLASDDAVAAEIARGADRAGACTFVAAVPGARARWTFTWAGDCRAYLLTRAGELRCLTLDDTYRNLREMPPAGGSADDPARMVGNGAIDRVNLGALHLREGETLLLCSDGVHRHVRRDEFVAILRDADTLDLACRKLAAAAHANGGTDDATVVAAARHGWFGLRGTWLWAAVALAVCLIMLAWHFLRAEPPAAPAVAAPSHDQPAAAIETPAGADHLAPPQAPVTDTLRLVPDRNLKSGLQPRDVAAPVKKPPAKAKPARPPEMHVTAETRRDKSELPGAVPVPVPTTENRP